ncbi:hypothetical protein HYY73_05195 [Candidatus Woesearchaeota archaeon]|nr:hypothetical protein [Candidatus Woesearchaeota archaeon]
MTMRKHAKAKKGRAGRSSARSSARSGTRSGRKHRKVHKARKAGIRKSHVSKASRKTAKSAKSGRSLQRLHKPHAVGQSKPSVVAAPSQFRKAADEVPTLEQVIITCANCGRPFKVLKLKGLSLEGTICQRCSLGEMELPESFG